MEAVAAEDKPRIAKLTLVTIYLIVFVDAFQLTFLLPLLPKIVQGMGKGINEVGILGAITPIAEGLAAPWLGALADRYGRKPIFMISAIGAAISTLTVGFSRTYAMLFTARLFGGMCGGCTGVAIAYIADVTTPDQRANYINYVLAAMFVGFILGPAVGPLLDRSFNYHVTCFSAASLSVLNLVFISMFLPDPPRAKAAPDQLPAQEDSKCTLPCAGLPMSAFLMGGAGFLQGLGLTAFEAIGVLYLQDTFFDGDASQATLFWASIIMSFGVTGMFVNMFLYPRVMHRLKQHLAAHNALKLSIVCGGLCTAASFVGLGLSHVRNLFFVFSVFFILGENVMGTSVTTLVTLVVDECDFGKAIGMMTLCNNIGKAMGPFVCTPLYGLGGRAKGWIFWHAVPWFFNCLCKFGTMILCGLVVPKASVSESVASAEQVLTTFGATGDGDANVSDDEEGEEVGEYAPLLVRNPS